MKDLARGFTLIELLVVIAIIGLLSSMILAALSAARGQANDARRVSDMKEVQKALEEYASDHNGLYPSTSSHWYSQCVAGFGANGNKTPDQVAPGLTPTYISTFPADPEMNATAGTCCYMYKSSGTDYKIDTGYNCVTSPAEIAGSGGHSSYTPLLDPARASSQPEGLAAYSGNIQTVAQCLGGSTAPACW